MAEDLTKLWGNFTLLEEKCLGIDISEQDIAPVVSRGSSCIVGKLLADRIVGKEIIETPLIWA